MSLDFIKHFSTKVGNGGIAALYGSDKPHVPAALPWVGPRSGRWCGQCESNLVTVWSRTPCNLVAVLTE